MTKHIILAQSRMTAAALGTFICLLKGRYRGGDELTARQIPDQIIWDDPIAELETYRVLVDEIEKKASGADGLIPVGEIVILVDHINLSRLIPTASNGWDSVVAMLILTFPEIHWVFGVVQGPEDLEAQALERDHGLLSMFAASADPLFDGTGLRSWVRSQVRKTSPEEAGYLPIRSKIAVAIDDECSYAYIHSYAAYKFGFRAYVVTEESLMEQLLGKDGCLRDSNHFQLSIEDFFLSFPDRSSKHKDTHWSDLTQRSQKLPSLDKLEVLRIFVTSGQNIGIDKKRSEQNDKFRKNLKNTNRLGTVIYKPLGGIYALWKKSRLLKILRGGRLHGQAEGFIWPPNYSDTTKTDLSNNHSAPGRLLEIASKLVKRAEKILQNVHCTIPAVQGAVLAVEVLELLGQKAPTTFLEALSLKHEFEARAECQFYGVQRHPDMKLRMNTIRDEVHNLSYFFKNSKCKETEWNAEVAILNCLLRVYQDYNHLEEELAIQVRNRTLHRRLWSKKTMWIFGNELRWLNPIYWVAGYFHILLRSMSCFLLIILLWIGGLSFLFTYTSPAKQSANWHNGIEDAVSSFFSVGSPTHHEDKSLTDLRSRNTQMTNLDERLARLETDVASIHDKVHEERNPPGYVAIICLAILAGFIHVGVFISHLYLIVSRK